MDKDKKIDNQEQVTQTEIQTQSIAENPYINTANTQDPQVSTPNVTPNITQNIQTQSPQPSLFDSINTQDFVKGALIGAGVTYLLTNENVQNGIMKMVAKGVGLFQTGVEEMKEKYEDAKAEIEAEKDDQ